VIDFSTTADPPVWSFGAEATGRGRGRVQLSTVRPPARLVVNTSDVAIAAAVAGHGITRGLSYVIEPEVRAGRLRIILADHQPPPIPIHVVHAGGRSAPAKVRSFVDFLVERLRAMKIA
jgi:DNA-binding transcriptional LysR family regulator